MSREQMMKDIEEAIKRLKDLMDGLPTLPGSSVMEEKPYDPPNGPNDLPICGQGNKKQLYQPPQTVVAFAVQPHAGPELSSLTNLINQILAFEGRRHIERESKKPGMETVHLTIAFDDDRGMYLSYAVKAESR